MYDYIKQHENNNTKQSKIKRERERERECSSRSWDINNFCPEQGVIALNEFLLLGLFSME